MKEWAGPRTSELAGAPREERGDSSRHFNLICDPSPTPFPCLPQTCQEENRPPETICHVALAAVSIPGHRLPDPLLQRTPVGDLRLATHQGFQALHTHLRPPQDVRRERTEGAFLSPRLTCRTALTILRFHATRRFDPGSSGSEAARSLHGDVSRPRPPIPCP